MGRGAGTGSLGREGVLGVTDSSWLLMSQSLSPATGTVRQSPGERRLLDLGPFPCPGTRPGGSRRGRLLPAEPPGAGRPLPSSHTRSQASCGRRGPVPDGQEVLGFFAGRTGRGSGTDRCSPAGASFTANALGRVRRGGASGVPRALLPNHAGRALTAEAAAPCARGRREGHRQLRLPHRWLPSPRPLGGDAGHHAAGAWRALGGSAVLAGVDGAPGRCARLRGAAQAGRGS